MSHRNLSWKESGRVYLRTHVHAHTRVFVTGSCQEVHPEPAQSGKSITVHFFENHILLLRPCFWGSAGSH